MRYDFSQGVAAAEFTEAFYREIDSRFFSDVKTFMPWDQIPFDPLIDFQSLGDKDVLEIGVGNGSHAQLISTYARSYTGIDLTDYAVKSTTKRLELSGETHAVMSAIARKPAVIRMDAEQMEFADNSFDLVWSWGVIHHSANTRKILEEMHRVLRPGGTATVMVYYRNFWNYYIFAGVFAGVIRGTLWKTKSLHQTRQKFIDGAIARYYTIPEWRSLVSDLFLVEDIKIYGSKSELLPLPSGRFKTKLQSVIPNSVGRLLTNQGRMGMFLVSALKK